MLFIAGVEVRMVDTGDRISGLVRTLFRRLHGHAVHLTDAGPRFHRRALHCRLSPVRQGALLHCDGGGASQRVAGGRMHGTGIGAGMTVIIAIFSTIGIANRPPSPKKCKMNDVHE